MPAMKRSNPAPTASPTKKKCCLIEEAIRNAEGAGLKSLTPTATATLAASVPFSLGLAKEERHTFQQEAVDMTGHVLEECKTNLEERVRVCHSAVVDAEKRRDELQAALQQKQSEADDAQGVANKSKLALAEDARAFQAAKAAVSEAEQFAAESCKELKAAADQKNEVEKLQQEMANLHEDDGKHLKGFVTRAERYVEGLDSSMVTAIPCVFAKDPSVRGQFDLMVVQQLTEKAQKTIAKFQAVIEGGATAEAERAAAVETTKAALLQAQQKQIEAARKYTETSKARAQIEESVQKAKSEITQARRVLKDASQKEDEAQVDLDLFRQDVIQTYAELRDRAAVAEGTVADTAVASIATVPAVIEVAA